MKKLPYIISLLLFCSATVLAETPPEWLNKEDFVDSQNRMNIDLYRKSSNIQSKLEETEEAVEEVEEEIRRESGKSKHARDIRTDQKDNLEDDDVQGQLFEFDDEKLSKNAKDAIRTLVNDIYVSTITYWEIALKYSLGKLELEGVTPDELPQHARRIDIETLTISEEEASTFYKLPRMLHKDPFDRLIIWQAIMRNLTLLSKDRNMLDYQRFGLKILW